MQLLSSLFQSMVSQASAAAGQRSYIDTSRQTQDDMELIIDWFLNEVMWFAIYSCILGVVMLIGTYVSIMLFNFAAHSQVILFIARCRFRRVE